LSSPHTLSPRGVPVSFFFLIFLKNLHNNLFLSPRVFFLIFCLQFFLSTGEGEDERLWPILCLHTCENLFEFFEFLLQSFYKCLFLPGQGAYPKDFLSPCPEAHRRTSPRATQDLSPRSFPGTRANKKIKTKLRKDAGPACPSFGVEDGAHDK
jgi:hypothetical protein